LTAARFFASGKLTHYPLLESGRVDLTDEELVERLGTAQRLLKGLLA
jgi:transcription initiation factor IIE alpha subunit